MFPHLGGLDHVVILVRDLDAARDTWAKLGFTLSPRGVHSAFKGTGNTTMMLGGDYLELLTVLAETPMNVTDRASLAANGEGVDRAALKTDDAPAALAAIRAAGFAGQGDAQSFARPVTRADGSQTEAAFRTFEWPAGETPGGLRLFACEHRTPDAVWLPELTTHPNGARRILRVEILAADPAATTDHLARMTGATATRDPDGAAHRVATGPGRADIVVLDPPAFSARYPGHDPERCRAAGAAALVLAVDDLAAAVPFTTPLPGSPARRVVDPADACGVMLVFEEA